MIIKNRLLDLDLCIYQNDEWFKFSLDSVLLSKFVTLNMRCKKIIDLACGNAPIPMFLSYRTNASIYGVEYQKEVFDLGIRSIRENKLSDRIQLFNYDVRNISDFFDSDSFDVVTCNPPYFRVNCNKFINDNSIKASARHEISLKLDDVLKSANYLLKTGGIFAMVHRTERMVEILDIFRKYAIEPKRIQFIYPKYKKNSDLFLIEGIINGRAGIKLLSPLIIHNDDNSYTDDVQKLLLFNNRGE